MTKAKATLKPTKKAIFASKKKADLDLFMKESYFCLKDMVEKPTSMTYIEQIAGILTRWARDDNSFSLEQFCCEMGINVATFYRWRDKCPALKKAADYAKTYVGIRRENGGLTNKLNAALVQATLPAFLDRYKETLEYREKIKSTEGPGGTQQQIVVIEKSKVTDIVPEKPSK